MGRAVGLQVHWGHQAHQGRWAGPSSSVGVPHGVPCASLEIAQVEDACEVQNRLVDIELAKMLKNLSYF